MRVDDLLQRHRELAERISIALDPDLVLDSDIDATTLQSLQNEVESLRQRTQTGEVRFQLSTQFPAVPPTFFFQVSGRLETPWSGGRCPRRIRRDE
jgi:hypothetical protein